MPIIPIYYSVKSGTLHISIEDAMDAELKCEERGAKEISDLMYKFECLRSDYNSQISGIKNKFKPEFDKIIKRMKDLNLNLDDLNFDLNQFEHRS